MDPLAVMQAPWTLQPAQAMTDRIR